MFEEWEKMPDGSLSVSRLTAWEGVVAPDCGVLRVQTVTAKPGATSVTNSALQLALSGEQLHDLAEALLRMAVELKTKQDAQQQQQ